MRAADRAWTPVTSWASAGVAAAAAVLLIALAYAGPSLPISETDFTGSTVFVARLAGGAFMVVLTASCLLRAGLLLPRRSSRAPGLRPAAVLDVLLIVGVVTEVALVLSVDFASRPHLDLAVLAGGAALALLALVRFVLVVTTGIAEAVGRRRRAAAVRHGS